jgi:hypothetical protein
MDVQPVDATENVSHICQEMLYSVQLISQRNFEMMKLAEEEIKRYWIKALLTQSFVQYPAQHLVLNNTHKLIKPNRIVILFAQLIN